MPRPLPEVPLTDRQSELMASCWPMAVKLAANAWERLHESCPLGHPDSVVEQDRRDFLMDEATKALMYSATRFDESRGLKFITIAHQKVAWRLLDAARNFRPRRDENIGEKTWDIAARPTPAVLDGREWFDFMLKGLSRREKRVMRWLYPRGLSHREAARKVGMSHTRVKQIRDMAVAKIQKKFEAA